MCPSAMCAVLSGIVVACLATFTLYSRISHAVPIQQSHGLLVTDDLSAVLRPPGFSSGDTPALERSSYRDSIVPLNLSFLSDVGSKTAKYRLVKPSQKLDKYGLYPKTDVATPRAYTEVPDHVPITALEYGQALISGSEPKEAEDLKEQVFTILRAEAETLEQAGGEIQNELEELGNTVEASVSDASSVISKSSQSKQLVRDFGQQVVRALNALAQRISKTARTVSQRLRTSFRQAELRLDPSRRLQRGIGRARAGLQRFKGLVGRKFRSMGERVRGLKNRLFRKKGSNGGVDNAAYVPEGFEDVEI